MLVLSDVHLSRSYGMATSADLAQLVARHTHCELVLAGDVVDLTLDAAQVTAQSSLQAALAPHQQLVGAVRKHVRAGGRVSFIPGNHDSTLAQNEAVTELRQLFEAPNDDVI